MTLIHNITPERPLCPVHKIKPRTLNRDCGYK